MNKRTQAIAALAEGVSINATCRMTGVAKHTVLKLLKDLGCVCAEYHNQVMRNLKVRRVQCDEIWAFVYAKQKNVTKEQMDKGAGDYWTWTAMPIQSSSSRMPLVIKEPARLTLSMQDLASRISFKVQLTTERSQSLCRSGRPLWRRYRLCNAGKIYGAASDSPESRYSQATCIGCHMGVLSCDPDPNHISTSYVERQNLSIRMGMRRFTRLTNGFSKKLENHSHAVALYFMHYNFCRVHKTLRVTPAMEAGLANHVWTLEELCNNGTQEAGLRS